jgi:hypothetical protein
MLYTLPSSGKTIELSFAQWYALTDDDIEDLICSNFGEYIEYPWRRSALEKPETPKEEEDVIEITDIHVADKFTSTEFSPEE